MFFLLVLFSVLCEVISRRPRTELLYKSLDLKLPKPIKREQTDLSEISFAKLENYEYMARPVSEMQYSWASRVVHSRSSDLPHICTAVCIDTGIFITAARCLYFLKVNFTTIIYGGQRMPVLAIVIPSVKSKQAFDDIGFLVVDPEKANIKGEWPHLQLWDKGNRTDGDYSWFKGPGNDSLTKVVGYSFAKYTEVTVDRRAKLTELIVVVGVDICPNILTPDNLKLFKVPCYHSCTLEEYKKRHRKCNNYHGVEGSAVIDTKSNKLIGIATWGTRCVEKHLPVGFSIPNSQKFFKDFVCARKIRDGRTENYKGPYQKLCA